MCSSCAQAEVKAQNKKIKKIKAAASMDFETAHLALAFFVGVGGASKLCTFSLLTAHFIILCMRRRMPAFACGAH
jgi:hypothetical protein